MRNRLIVFFKALIKIERIYAGYLETTLSDMTKVVFIRILVVLYSYKFRI